MNQFFDLIHLFRKGHAVSNPAIWKDAANATTLLLLLAVWLPACSSLLPTFRAKHQGFSLQSCRPTAALDLPQTLLPSAERAAVEADIQALKNGELPPVVVC